jgi:hypothetical protein
VPPPFLLPSLPWSGCHPLLCGFLPIWPPWLTAPPPHNQSVHFPKAPHVLLALPQLLTPSTKPSLLLRTPGSSLKRSLLKVPRILHAPATLC